MSDRPKTLAALAGLNAAALDAEARRAAKKERRECAEMIERAMDRVWAVDKAELRGILFGLRAAARAIRRRGDDDGVSGSTEGKR